MTTEEIGYGDGWYEWEYDDYFPFRWMRASARITLPRELLGTARYLSIAASSDIEERGQSLTVAVGDHLVAVLDLLPRWHLYDIEPPGSAQRDDSAGTSHALTLRVNRLFPGAMHPDDPRELGLRVGPLELHDDARRHRKVIDFYECASAEQCAAREEGPGRRVVTGPADRAAVLGQPEDLYGWYEWTFDDCIPYRWMTRTAAVRLPDDMRRRRFGTAPISGAADDLSQVVTISSARAILAEVPLLGSWEYVTFPLPAPDDPPEIRFSVNRAVPMPLRHGGDAGRWPDAMGVRVGPLEAHDDEARYERGRFFLQNAARNEAEFRAGATVLHSFPLALGIDLYGKCNVKPPCVYCLFERAKCDEGDNVNAVVDERTLAEYGSFLTAARSLVNCSIGEPLLHPRLEQIVDFIGSSDKTVEIATNGQAFTPAVVRALAGRRIILCISLDSASAGTYARLRNDRWHDVIAGLTHLRDARAHANGLPIVHMVFMPMRANLHDLERYFKLCRMVSANALVLRPLNYLDNPGIQTDRGGYHFDYAAELLTRDEIAAVVGQCAEYSNRYGVPVANLFDFGMEPQQVSER